MPEDYPHARNVREWVRKLRPQASAAVQVAALAHDIERALPERKVRREDYPDFDAFKRAHARNSARVTGEILDEFDLTDAFKKRVSYLIEHHEFGGREDEELLALKDADALSFFDVNLPYYAKRHTPEEILFRMRWGIQRLSPRGRAFLPRFQFRDERLDRLFRECVRAA